MKREEFERRRDALFARHPNMFPAAEPSPLGWSIMPGWLDIVERLCADLAAIVPEQDKARLYVAQVKEKFGTLRFYLDVAPFRFDIISPGGLASGSLPAPKEENPAWLERALALVKAAEQESSRRCLFCGAPGTLRTDRFWVVTACDEHADAARREMWDEEGHAE